MLSGCYRLSLCLLVTVQKQMQPHVKHDTHISLSGKQTYKQHHNRLATVKHNMSACQDTQSALIFLNIYIKMGLSRLTSEEEQATPNLSWTGTEKCGSAAQSFKWAGVLKGVGIFNITLPVSALTWHCFSTEVIKCMNSSLVDLYSPRSTLRPYSLPRRSQSRSHT